MKIGFDISLSFGERTGCGFFTYQLMRSLIKNDKKNQYTLYPAFYLTIPKYKNLLKMRIGNLPWNFKKHFNYLNPFRYLQTRLRWFFLKNTELKITKWLGSPDIIHSNSFTCFKNHDSKIIFTLYDVVPLSCPETVHEETWMACSQGLINASLYADYCIAISEYTKKTFLQYFPYYPSERIKVVPLAVRDQIHKIESQQTINSVLKKYDIPEKFWFSSGTVEPRKNYGMLIDAYAKSNPSFPLIIAGGKGWKQSSLPEKIKKMGLQDKIRFLGYVSDEELSALYSSCYAFIYPSIYEGFGLPILEAMYCGAAVICSNSSSMPEVGGDAVLYIDPFSLESLTHTIKKLDGNESLRNTLKSAGLERSKLFSWDRVAAKVMESYEEVSKLSFYTLG